MKYLKNSDDSKDATSQIFEKLMTDLLRMEVTNFKSWIYMVSKNYCLMELRKHKDQHNVDISSLEHQIAEQDQIEKINLKESQLNHLEQAVEQLKPEQKNCIELFYLKNKSYEEVAAETGYDLKKVKSYIQNGKRNLKLLMEQENVK